jgi:hypothetical protein
VKKKLQLKPGMTLAVVNARPGYPVPEGAEPATAQADALLLFAENRAELDAGLGVVGSVRPGGILWIAYRKGGARAGTDLDRDILREYLQPKGLTAVSLVALDATWSAMRFKPG